MYPTTWHFEWVVPRLTIIIPIVYAHMRGKTNVWHILSLKHSNVNKPKDWYVNSPNVSHPSEGEYLPGLSGCTIQ